MSKTTISISGTTTVDVDYDEDVKIEDLTDDQLLACVKEAIKRKLHLEIDADSPERKYTLEAYEELLGHRRENAIAALERALWPSSAAFTAQMDIMNAFHRKSS